MISITTLNSRWQNCAIGGKRQLQGWGAQAASLQCLAACRTHFTRITAGTALQSARLKIEFVSAGSRNQQASSLRSPIRESAKSAVVSVDDLETHLAGGA